MGRKKSKFYITVPQGVLKHLDVIADGNAVQYKQAHLLSFLTHHTVAVKW